MMRNLDERADEAAHLSDALRAWLRARREPPELVATALAYELTALLALHAPSKNKAFAAIDAWAKTARQQIARLGVGGEHP